LSSRRTFFQDVCSILLTLHLLESRPLIDVLTVFLAQRARSLHAALSQSPKSAPNGSSLNGSVHPKSKKVVVREVREGLEVVFESITSTVGLARDVFRNRGQEDPSLMFRVLSFIQSDVSERDSSLPSDLQMSTQHLLSTLPSASHFVLLPTTIRSYKPFVDLDSTTSSVPCVQLALQLREWFSKAVVELRSVAKGWFAELRTLKEVWVVRSWFSDWLGGKELEDEERQELAEVVDDVAHSQAVKILRTVLGDLQGSFRDELQNTLSQLRASTSEAVVGMFTSVCSPKEVSEQIVCDQRALLQSSYSSLSHLPLSISVWDPPWFPRSEDMDQPSNDKSMVERHYSTGSCLPSKTVQKPYKRTLRGKFAISFRTLTMFMYGSLEGSRRSYAGPTRR